MDCVNAEGKSVTNPDVIVDVLSHDTTTHLQRTGIIILYNTLYWCGLYTRKAIYKDLPTGKIHTSRVCV